jgi:hypothetical protein
VENQVKWLDEFARTIHHVSEFFASYEVVKELAQSQGYLVLYHVIGDQLRVLADNAQKWSNLSEEIDRLTAET